MRAEKKEEIRIDYFRKVSEMLSRVQKEIIKKYAAHKKGDVLDGKKIEHIRVFWRLIDTPYRGYLHKKYADGSIASFDGLWEDPICRHDHELKFYYHPESIIYIYDKIQPENADTIHILNNKEDVNWLLQTQPESVSGSFKMLNVDHDIYKGDRAYCKNILKRYESIVKKVFKPIFDNKHPKFKAVNFYVEHDISEDALSTPCGYPESYSHPLRVKAFNKKGESKKIELT